MLSGARQGQHFSFEQQSPSFSPIAAGASGLWRSSAAACQHRVETQMHAGVQSLVSGRTSKPSFSDSVAVGGKVMRYLSLTPPPPKLLLS